MSILNKLWGTVGEEEAGCEADEHGQDSEDQVEGELCVVYGVTHGGQVIILGIIGQRVA